VPGNFGVNARSTSFGMFFALQYEGASSFGEDEALPFGIEGARGSLRLIVVVDRQSLHGAEASNRPLANQRFRTAGNDDVHRAAANQLEAPNRLGSVAQAVEMVLFGPKHWKR
jgi:hypothetical protein